jgi:hypothetical protein
MMKSVSVSSLVLTALLLMSPVAASATETGATAQPAASAPAAKPAAEDKKICKQLPSSSSRLPQRVCLTEKQWKQIDDDNR